MTQYKRLFFILPLFIIFTELVYINLGKKGINLEPESSKNTSPNQLISLLRTSKISPGRLILHGYSNEIEFEVKNKNETLTKVFMSTTKNPIDQVNALQKLIKIANIKQKNIQFIDLSSNRPYATF